MHGGAKLILLPLANPNTAAYAIVMGIDLFAGSQIASVLTRHRNKVMITVLKRPILSAT